MFQITLSPTNPDIVDPNVVDTFHAAGSTLAKAVSNLLISLPPVFDQPEELATLLGVLREAVEDAETFGDDSTQAARGDNRSFPGDPDAFEIVITKA